MFNKIQLQVPTKLTESERVLSWFEQLNYPPLTDSRIWWQCQILLQEAFTNIVEHAHKNLSPETPIALEALRSERTIEIWIWCWGEPFDLAQKLQEISELEDNENERGRGLKIMSKIADGLSYKRMVDNRNCLWIEKKY